MSIILLIEVNWVAIGAIVSMFMVIATFVSVWLSRQQLKEMQKQWNEMRSPRLSLAIAIHNGHFLLKVENEGETVANNVTIQIDNHLKDIMFCKHYILSYNKIEEASYSIDRYSHKYFYLWPIYGRGTVSFYDTNETYCEKQFHTWVIEHKDDDIRFACFYKGTMAASLDVKMGDLLGYSASIIEDPATAILELNNTLLKTNKILTDRSC